ncbi:MAG TPA: hypothetical protein VFH33_07570 [Candidatus Krumholzibacteria bacterium]|nr:hypothetical protein [Candidatus Krumholzibacteria bacterium]
MFKLETWELLSYVVTVIGLPAAILAFLYEKRKERQSDENEVHQLLSDNYQDFLKLALEHSDLQLFSPEETPELSAEQHERMLIVFGVLVSIFERAYVLMYEKRMSKDQARRWIAWEDYMREWCRRNDFRRLLPELLKGEDPDFRAYIESLATGTSAR